MCVSNIAVLFVFLRCLLPHNPSMMPYTFIVLLLGLMQCFLCTESPDSCPPPAGTWWAVWRCWWLKIIWSSTWTERRLETRCPASAGWRDATRWSTEGGRLWRKYSHIYEIIRWIIKSWRESELGPLCYMYLLSIITVRLQKAWHWYWQVERGG